MIKKLIDKLNEINKFDRNADNGERSKKLLVWLLFTRLLMRSLKPQQ
ncbi:MAG: hypothetical protein R3A12_00315 [Ignavibacteria bacterium]